MELKKQWNDGSGDNLTATYQGEKKGVATFSSVTNEGIDREMPVYFKSGDHTFVERNVVQEGRREYFLSKDGDFIFAKGGSFNVLKLSTHEKFIVKKNEEFVFANGLVLKVKKNELL